MPTSIVTAVSRWWLMVDGTTILWYYIAVLLAVRALPADREQDTVVELPRPPVITPSPSLLSLYLQVCSSDRRCTSCRRALCMSTRLSTRMVEFYRVASGSLLAEVCKKERQLKGFLELKIYKIQTWCMCLVVLRWFENSKETILQGPSVDMSLQFSNLYFGHIELMLGFPQLSVAQWIPTPMPLDPILSFVHSSSKAQRFAHTLKQQFSHAYAIHTIYWASKHMY